MGYQPFTRTLAGPCPRPALPTGWIASLYPQSHRMVSPLPRHVRYVRPSNSLHAEAERQAPREEVRDEDPRWKLYGVLRWLLSGLDTVRSENKHLTQILQQVPSCRFPYYTGAVLLSPLYRSANTHAIFRSATRMLEALPGNVATYASQKTTQTP